MGGRVGRVQLEAALEGRHRLLDLVQSLVDTTLVVQVHTVARVQVDRLLEVVQGLLVVF